MEDNKLIIIFAVIVVIIIILASALGLFYYFQTHRQIPAEPILIETPVSEPATTTATGFLPITPDTAQTEEEKLTKEMLEKEKRFVSSYWQKPEISIKAQTKSYKLPLAKPKEQTANYWDVSRKINIDSALPTISKNGFAVINNPFKPEAASDWQTAYENLKKNKLPIFITADSIAGVYLDTLDIVYRETEQNIFYSSLWEMLKELFDKVNTRYDSKKRVLGIESDLVTEANRLELAYLSVALKLMAPNDNQVKEALAGDYRYFSPLEKQKYTFTTPKELNDEVNREIALIAAKNTKTKSPTLLYERDYKTFAIPAYYQSSEKLKNYYLAVTWLNDTLFPLYSQEDNCPDCLLESQDHAVNLVSALYLSKDISSNQNLKNRWANIYKTVGFFHGIEAGLTYLYYNEAMVGLNGQDYDLDKIFPGPIESNHDRIEKVKNKIAAFKFPTALNNQEKKEEVGLRLLRQKFLPEEQLYQSLANKNSGKYLEEVEKTNDLPFTGCSQDKANWRCYQTALDLFSALEFSTAHQVLVETKNNRYENYPNIINSFAQNFTNFDSKTWHDNAYLSLIWSLKSIKNQNLDGYPTFMQTEAWKSKNLNTTLGIWADFHKELNFERTTTVEEDAPLPAFTYGYIEMQPQFYAELKANVEMIMTGFASLEIITPKSNSYERLTTLRDLLDNMIRLSKKELEKTSSFTKEDYDYINNFNKQIRLITGDIKKTNLNNQYAFNLENFVTQKIDGINYIIVVYPEESGKLIMALGPVFNYSETRKDARLPWAYQNEYR